jgi:hypothetical protein
VSSPLVLTREQILAFRRHVGALDERLPSGPVSLRQAAWAGLQDSMPRAALLSIHARVEGAGPYAWDDESLAQVWGTRYQVYVVPAVDVPAFTLGPLPDDEKGRRRAEDAADSLHDHLRGRTMGYGEAGKGMGVHANSLRYGAKTGRVLIRWEGARQPMVWTIPPPEIPPDEARRELARRYLHVFGPTTAAAFAKWAGIHARAAVSTFASLAESLAPVRTPIGDAWILAGDEALVLADERPATAARLLPSGDAYWLLWGADRELLVPDAGRRGELWTPRVWPGAILVSGEIRGTWRRAHDVLSIQGWGRFSRAERETVEAEAAALPLPGVDELRISWSS